MLAPSLGGNSLTTVIVCVACDAEEAAGTSASAAWAAQVMGVVNRVKVVSRIAIDDAEVQRRQLEIPHDDIPDTDGALMADRRGMWIHLAAGGGGKRLRVD
jgi:hypothetical protein